MLRTLLAPLLIAANLVVPSYNYHKTVERAEGSIVRVTGLQHDARWGDYPYVCTGFVVAPNTVMTAAHCLGDSMTADGVPLMSVDKFDPLLDVAVVSVQTDKTPMVFRLEPLKVWEGVTSIGYGLGESFMIPVPMSVISVNQAGGWVDGTESVLGVWYLGEFKHGMSGGPIIDHKGRIVGIVQQVNEGIGFGVDADTLWRFMEE